MALALKKLRHQIIVITGATSGIGLTTARMAARRGARLVLAARSENALIELERELSGDDRRVVTVTADVGRPADVQRISRMARQKFGGFDTWVNNAGVSIYGRLLDEPIEDMRRLFETNFWGLVYGSLEAARYFKERQQAGAIIAARQRIVEGAVGMVEMALDMLSAKSIIQLDEERKAAMVSNLLVVLCGDRNTQPVINTGTIYQ